jgi:transposase
MGESLDIAKSVFQVDGIDVAGVIVIRIRASRAKVLEYFRDLPRHSAGNSALGLLN